MITMLCISCMYICGMTNGEKHILKACILKCLTRSFKGNVPLFDRADGFALFDPIDLDMVMGAVIDGLDMGRAEINRNDEKDGAVCDRTGKSKF